MGLWGALLSPEIPITRCSGGREQRHKIAQDLLDFGAVGSVCGGAREATMDRAAIEPDSF
jgi:hypothetical protein